jgi:hypothetical protein
VVVQGGYFVIFDRSQVRLGSDATGKRREMFKSYGDNNEASTTKCRTLKIYKKKGMP